MTTASHRSTLESVPKQFVASLRVLFDILDEDKTGFVKLGDIETRWKDEGVNGLPVGVVEALRKVTPPSGKLSFERFVAGLKIALLRTKVSDDPRKPNEHAASMGPRPDLLSHAHGPPLLHQAPVQTPGQSQPLQTSSVARDGYPGTLQGFQGYHGNHQESRRPFRPTLQTQHDKPQQYPPSHRLPNPSQHGPITAAVRPNNAVPLAQNRTKSMPLIGAGNEDIPQTAYNNFGEGQGPNPSHEQVTQRPGLRHETASAPRLGWSQSQSSAEANVGPSQGKSKDEIVNALKKWQRDRMISDDAGDAVQDFDKGRFSSGPMDKRPLSIASTSAFEHFGTLIFHPFVSESECILFIEEKLIDL